VIREDEDEAKVITTRWQKRMYDGIGGDGDRIHGDVSHISREEDRRGFRTYIQLHVQAPG